MDGQHSALDGVSGACAGDGFKGIQLSLGVCGVAGTEIEPHLANEAAGGCELRGLLDLDLAASPVCDPPRMESHAYADVGRGAEAGPRGERVGRGDGGAEQGHIVRRRFARDLIGVSHAVEVTVHIEQAPTVLETRRFGARVRGGHFDAWGFRVNRSLVPPSPRAFLLAHIPVHARPPRLPASCPFCAASCMASAAETSSPSPRPEMWRRTSPAIIWPMMGGMKLAVPKSVRSERAAPGAAADGGCRACGIPCA